MIQWFVAKTFDFLSGGLADKFLSTYVQLKTSSAEVDKEAIRASVEKTRAEAALLMAEQGNWVTRSIRPLLALPFIIYWWKLIFWDKVVGSLVRANEGEGWNSLLFQTPALSGELNQIGMVVVGAYMLTRPFEKRR